MSNPKKLVILLLVAISALVFAKYFMSQKRTQLPYDQIYTFKGNTLSYSKIGSGKPVILLHGSLLSDPWDGWEEKLAKKYTVYLPHLPGYGASDAIDNQTHDIDLYVESICEYIKQNNLKDANILGHSFGSIIALKAAEQECIQGKIILAGLPLYMDGTSFTDKIPLFIKRYLASTKFGKRQFIIPTVLGNIGSKSSNIDSLLAKLLENDPRTYSDINISNEINGRISKIVNDTDKNYFYLFGQNDNLLQVFKDRTNKEPIVIEDADHNIFASQPDRSLEAIEKILGE